MRVNPIPPRWLNTVLRLLRKGNAKDIEWTGTALGAWSIFGLEQAAYELLISTLSVPGVLGNQVTGMRDRRDGTYTDCWAFLCDHPWGSPVPLYAKIGVHNSHLHINLFSLHPDDGSRQLENAIKEYHELNK